MHNYTATTVAALLLCIGALLIASATQGLGERLKANAAEQSMPTHTGPQR